MSPSHQGRTLLLAVQLCAGIVAQACEATSAASRHLRPEAACAAYDLHLTTLIEEHGRAEELGGKALVEAFMLMLDARRACRTGAVEQALQLYAGIVLDPPSIRLSE